MRLSPVYCPVNCRPIKDLIRSEVQLSMHLAKLSGAMVAALAKRDVNIAFDVAANAVETNYLKTIIAAVKYFAKKEAKDLVKEGSKKTAKQIEKKAEKELAKEGLSDKTKELLGKTDTFKKELLEREKNAKSQTTLRAAQKELKGEQLDIAKERDIEYDHSEKVGSAQRGLFNLIKDIKNRLGFPKLPEVERKALEKELSEGRKSLRTYTMF